jgi:two-component sensor histidine kinase
VINRNARLIFQYILQRLFWIAAPAAGFGLFVGLLTGEWLVSFVISFTISTSILVLRELDWRFIRPRLIGLPRERRLVLEIVSALAEHLMGAAAAYLVSCVFLQSSLSTTPTWAWAAMAGSIFVMSLIIQSIGYAVTFYREVREKEVQEEHLRMLAAQAELRALKAQINPHFLFNTLNTIAELIHTDPAHAEEIVERLAEMFRYILAGTERGLVSLEEELVFVDRYLEIERARFGNRLSVTRNIAADALGVSVPGLILQPLVENAIRHGHDAGGSVDVSICVEPQVDAILITIADRGPGMQMGREPQAGHGHGLRNVDERLRKTYGEAYALQITSNEPTGVVLRLKIPLSEE